MSTGYCYQESEPKFNFSGPSTTDPGWESLRLLKPDSIPDLKLSKFRSTKITSFRVLGVGIFYDSL